jgi:hypothetical protein
MSSTYSAEIAVREAGYRWEATGSDPLGRLVFVDANVRPPRAANPPAGNGTAPDADIFRTYDPLADESALFRNFAELGPLNVFNGPAAQRSQEISQFGHAVLQFVNAYGAPLPALSRSRGGLQPDGQAIAWEIAQMQFAVWLWEAVKLQNWGAIASAARWDGEFGWRVTYGGYEFTPTGRWSEWAALARAYERELRPVEQSSSPGGNEHVLALRILEDLVGMHVDARPKFYQPRRGVYALRIRTEDLLSALWLQLAMMLVEDKRYQRCLFCGKFFEVGAHHGGRQRREDKQFCTDSCRVKSYKRRQVIARKMHAEGTPLRAIAKAVQSDSATVKRWLGE